VGLRVAKDPRLVQPLLRSLADDPDASVRMQAAYTLANYLDEPGVLAALRRAAAEDPDSKPAVICCIDTVREAAERASIADHEFNDWVRTKLLNESLPARSRLYALSNGSMDGRFVQSLAEIGDDAANVVFRIGRQEQEPGVRALAWSALGRAAPDKSFVPVLLGDLNNFPDEYVRAAAAEVLTKHIDDPDVRAALERALDDPSMAVRRIAARVVRADP
jgi:HEAT repeat protein